MLFEGGVMPQFAANLTMMYNEYDFLARFAAAAKDGFQGVEYLFPYAYAPETLADQLQSHGLQQVLFNAPPGNWEAGERGLACLPERRAEFREGVVQALAYAQALHCPRIHVMAGLLSAQATPVEQQLAWQTYRENIAWAAEQAARVQCTLMLEPINGRDMPGYLLQTQAQAHEVVQSLGYANVQVQMDLYHCQIVEGDVTRKLEAYMSTGRVGHIQIAGVPDRHEPDAGELNYPHLFATLDRLGYAGWVGCEYRPRASTTQGLQWLRDWQALERPVSGF